MEKILSTAMGVSTISMNVSYLCPIADCMFVAVEAKHLTVEDTREFKFVGGCLVTCRILHPRPRLSRICEDY